MISNEVKILGIIGFVSVALIIGAVFFLSRSTNFVKPPEAVRAADLVLKSSFQTGNGSEKVKVVEFSDFQCPACRAVAPTLEKIAADYKGQVSLVYRYFPLPTHKNALPSSYFAESVGQEGKFWQLYPILFETQDEWGLSDDPNSFFEKYATDLGLDFDKLKKVMDSDAVHTKIKADVDYGNSIGVNATPTIYVNGEKIEGVPTYEILKQKIDSALKK